jgi:hypothetical protein
MSEEREKVPRSPDETAYEALRLEEMKIRVDGARVEHARQIAQTEHEDRVRRMELEGIRARQAHEDKIREMEIDGVRAVLAYEQSQRDRAVADDGDVDGCMQVDIAASFSVGVTPMGSQEDRDNEDVDAVVRFERGREDAVEEHRRRLRHVGGRVARLRGLKARILRMDAVDMLGMVTGDVETAIRFLNIKHAHARCIYLLHAGRGGGMPSSGSRSGCPRSRGYTQMRTMR